MALHTEDVLTHAGYRVVGPAYDLAEAKQLAATEEIDRAVLDINLADEFVWPAAEILHRRGVHFMLLSGFGSKFELPAFCQGASRVSKPLSKPEFLAAIEDLTAGPRSEG